MPLPAEPSSSRSSAKASGWPAQGRNLRGLWRSSPDKQQTRLPRRGIRSWQPVAVAAVITAALVCLPLLSVIYLALSPEENIWPHLRATVLPGYISNTLLLMLFVAVGTLLIGVWSAWLVTFYRFPGRSFFSWALLLPFSMPAYVIAYVYTDLLEYAGPLQTALRSLFGWNSAVDYYFPPIRSLGGAACMLTLVLYPYVYLLTRASLTEQSPSLLEAARVFGMRGATRFFRVSLPLARPAIAIGLAMVMMETLNDYGTVDYFAVHTLSAGIYDVWLGSNNLGGGAQIASILMLFALTMVALERLARRRQRQYQPQANRYRQSEYTQLRGANAVLAVLACALPVLLGFIVPAAVLTDYAIHYFDISWTRDFRQTALNSLMLASSGAVLTLLAGLLLAYGARLSPRPALLLCNRLASVGYAIPGAVLAIGVMIPLASLDNTIDGLMQHSFGINTGLLLSGSVFALLFAYCVRFLAVALGAVEASLGKITPSMDMAARTLGMKPLKILRTVHAPLIRSGLLTALLVVFVDCLKELPATLILRPFNFDTLATHVYQFASDELLEESALAALLIVLTGLIPVLLLSRSIDRSRELPGKTKNSTS